MSTIDIFRQALIKNRHLPISRINGEQWDGVSPLESHIPASLLCLENESTNAATTSFPRRGSLLVALQDAVDLCVETRGGVVALLGAPGFGKSVVAHQFVAENIEAIYFDGFADCVNGVRQPPKLQLSGIPVLDEAWQFRDASFEIWDYVVRKQGVVIVIAYAEAEVRAFCGDLLKSVVHVPHWNNPQWDNHESTKSEIEKQHSEETLMATQIISHGSLKHQVIRFRSPNGESWTGFGRTPNWLKALESNGMLRDQFRVDNTPLKRKKYSSY